MRLYHTDSSPFARKVMVVAHELALVSRIETTFLRPSPLKTDAQLSRANPLSKIPALVLDDGTTLYDSPVICEYLETLAPERALTPRSGAARFRVLRLQALCDGILDAGILVRMERMERPKEAQSEAWVTGQTAKALQGFDELEKEVGSFVRGTIDLAQICAAITLGWIEFRNPIGDVRKGRPKLAAWYDEFVKRPSMAATMPKA